MKRIDTATAETDKHGTGRDGFTFGDPLVPTLPTEVDDTILDAFQEELANTVELNGGTLDDADSFQVAGTVLSMARDVLSGSAGSVASGLTWSDSGGLTVTMVVGVFYANGRRYRVRSVDGADAPRTLADSDTRYLYIEPDPADPRGYIIVDRSSLTVSYDSALTAVVVTSGGTIDSITNWASGATARVNSALLRLPAIQASSNAATIGLSGSPTSMDGINGRFTTVYANTINYGTERSSSSNRRETERSFDEATLSGVGTDDTVIATTGGRSNNDTLTLTITVSGRRTDAGGFGYSARIISGAQFDSGVWTLTTAAVILHELGSGGGARTARIIIDSSDRVVIRYELTGAEDWTFSTDVEVVYNYQ